VRVRLLSGIFAAVIALVKPRAQRGSAGLRVAVPPEKCPQARGLLGCGAWARRYSSSCWASQFLSTHLPSTWTLRSDSTRSTSYR